MTYNEAFRKRIRENYPPGTRIELVSLANEERDMPAGLRGTVDFVDDWPQIHMKWDNGRTLALIPGEDSFYKIEQAADITHECVNPADSTQEQGMSL